MDFLLEDEMIDLVTFCLQNPDSSQVQSKKQRFTEIGRELFAQGSIDATENFFFAIQNRITEEIGKDPLLLENCGRAFLMNGNNYRYYLEK